MLTSQASGESMVDDQVPPLNIQLANWGKKGSCMCKILRDDERQNSDWNPGTVSHWWNLETGQSLHRSITLKLVNCGCRWFRSGRILHCFIGSPTPHGGGWTSPFWSLDLLDDSSYPAFTGSWLFSSHYRLLTSTHEHYIVVSGDVLSWSTTLKAFHKQLIHHDEPSMGHQWAINGPSLAIYSMPSLATHYRRRNQLIRQMISAKSTLLVPSILCSTNWWTNG